MKKLFYILLIGIFTSCSTTKFGYHKPTRKEIKESMKYSDWRYEHSTKPIHSNYINYVNYNSSVPQKDNQ